MTPVYKLSASSITGRTTYGSMLAGNTAYVLPGDFESIATVTVGSGGAANAEFTSIPSTYSHLQIRMITKSTDSGTTGNDNIYIRYNSDTGSNYSWHYLAGNGSAASAGGASNSTWLISGKLGNSNVASTFGVSIVDILDYANTNKYKTQRLLSGIDLNGAQNGNMYMASGSWRNTNAITSITIINGDLANWVQHSHFALYGIRSA